MRSNGHLEKNVTIAERQLKQLDAREGFINCSHILLERILSSSHVFN